MAIIFSAGQVVPQSEWEALVRQHGGDKPAVRRSRTEAEIKAAALAGEDDPAAMQNPVYRSNLEDGSYVEYRTAPNGTDFQIVDYHPSPTFTQAQTKAAADEKAKAPPAGAPFKDDDETKGQTGRRWGWNPETGAYDRDLGPSPAAQGIGVKPGQDESMGSETSTDAQGKTVKITTYKRPDGTTYTKTDSAQAAPEKPQVVPGTLNTTSPNIGTVGPDGSVTWAPNPNYQKPKPEPLTLPPTQKWVVYQNPDGTTTTEKNPNYRLPSRIEKDPTTGQYIEVTEDENGKPIIRPVSRETTIKPSELPVLQAKYGEIAQGLGALAQDLNGRVSRGEMTPEERTAAFTAAHQQAQTQVAEINSILDNSRAIWTSQVTQRGQSLNETQSRRSYAQGIFGNAAQTGMSIAQSAGPGSGKAIAGGVAALMNIGQRYAEGMGGFRESPEVPLPTALGQAQSIGIPGFDTVYPGGGSGISETTDRGGVPRVRTPASSGAVPAPGGGPSPSLPPPIFRPGPPEAAGAAPGGINPPAGQPGHDPTRPVGMAPGTNPLLATMAQQLQSGFGFGGSPVAAGGLGMFDPTQEASRMAGDGSDPIWEQAVRQAAQAVNQPGYAWDRFAAPATRFG